MVNPRQAIRVKLYKFSKWLWHILGQSAIVIAMCQLIRHKINFRLFLWKVTIGPRKWLAGHFRKFFPRFYSVLDSGEEIPVQAAAYKLIASRYLLPEDTVLDVGFGLGYGLEIMSTKAQALTGIEVDSKAVEQVRKTSAKNKKIVELRHFDGEMIPYETSSFDVVTCIDVIEHVPDYVRFLKEMCRVARRAVILSTPNRRPEYTNEDGTPKNPWHIREWSYEEFDEIIRQASPHYEWNFINGPWEGPLSISAELAEDTLALTPALFVKG